MDFTYQMINDEPYGAKVSAYGRVQLLPKLRIEFKIEESMARLDLPIFILLRSSDNPMNAIHWHVMEKIDMEQSTRQTMEIYELKKFGWDKYCKVTFYFNTTQEGMYLKIKGTFNDRAKWATPNFDSNKMELIDEGLIINHLDLVILKKRAQAYREASKSKIQELKCLI